MRGFSKLIKGFSKSDKRAFLNREKGVAGVEKRHIWQEQKNLRGAFGETTPKGVCCFSSEGMEKPKGIQENQTPSRFAF